MLFRIYRDEYTDTCMTCQGFAPLTMYIDRVHFLLNLFRLRHCVCIYSIQGGALTAITTRSRLEF